MMLTLADAVEALVDVRPNAPAPISEAAGSCARRIPLGADRSFSGSARGM